MRQQSSQMILGQPVQKIQGILQDFILKQSKAAPLEEIIDNLTNDLEIPREDAANVFQGLRREGYIEIRNRPAITLKYIFVDATKKSKALLETSESTPFTKPKTKAILAEFLKRVKEVNKNDEFLYNITSVKIFSRYWRKTLSFDDLSIRINYECKIPGEGISLKTFKKLMSDVCQGIVLKDYETIHIVPFGEVLSFITPSTGGVRIIVESDPCYLDTLKWQLLYSYEPAANDTAPAIPSQSENQDSNS